MNKLLFFSSLSLSVQLLLADTHFLSFIVVRGSVPVYWTQPGNRYRPLPIIEQCKWTHVNSIMIYNDEYL